MLDRETQEIIIQNINELRTQIERDGAQTERQCAKLLKKIAWVLLSPLRGSPKYVTCDQFSSVGQVDMFVVAETWGAGPNPYLQAYVWELKAPQLELFEVETQNRARPTEYLCSAENQLLHYYHTIKHDLQFLTRMEIQSINHVHLGGIIMGRNRNYVKCYDPQEQDNAMPLAKQAHEIREIYFYQGRIKLWTWDWVLELAKIHSYSYQRIIGTISGSTSVEASQPSGDLIFL